VTAEDRVPEAAVCVCHLSLAVDGTSELPTLNDEPASNQDAVGVVETWIEAWAPSEDASRVGGEGDPPPTRKKLEVTEY
jgi:hypothetical protein